MKYRQILVLFFFLGLTGAYAQPSEKTKIRIVDSLTKQERNSRNPIILKTELDSMIQAYNASLPPVIPPEPVKEIVREVPAWISVTGVAALLVIALLLYLLFGYHRRLTRTVGDLKRLMQHVELYAASDTRDVPDRNAKGKAALEKKLAALSTELAKEKEALQHVTREYGLIKQSIAEVYKVRNYPSFDKQKSEDQIIMDLLSTEKAIAHQAFEKFLKPVITITDANKNNPARISDSDSARLLDLLVSLSLYHIEYLYLRINDLAVGGNIVQRIASNGKGIDPSLLKKLNTEHGSRALVLRLALDRAGISSLSYPVFDETDLNNH